MPFSNRADEDDHRVSISSHCLVLSRCHGSNYHQDEEIDIETRSSRSSHQTPVGDDALDDSHFADRFLRVTRPTSDTQTFRLLQYYVQKVGPWVMML